MASVMNAYRRLNWKLDLTDSHLSNQLEKEQERTKYRVLSLVWRSWKEEEGLLRNCNILLTLGINPSRQE